MDAASLSASSYEALIAVLENMPVLLIAIDDQGRLVVWNRECERCTGYTADEMLGRNVRGTSAFQSRHTPAGPFRMWRLFEGAFRDRDVELQTKNGDVCVVSWSNISDVYPVPGWSSWVVGIDVTRHAHHAGRSERLQQLTAALSEAVTLEQVADIVANIAVPILGAYAGIICLTSDDGEHLDLLAHRGASPSFLSRFPDYPIEDSRSAIAEAVRLQQPVWSPTAEAYEARFPGLSGGTVQSTGKVIAALPLILKGRVIGAISFAFPRPQTFDRESRAYIFALAHQCAQALERVQLLRREAETRATLQARIRQQSLIARLGLRALRADVQTLMNELAVAVSEALGVEFVKVLELIDGGERFLLRAGTGWHDGLIGNLIITAGVSSQAGYALLNKGPVIVNDLRSEKRFEDPEMLMDHGVVSGMSVILETSQGPYGVLGAHTRTQRVFTDDDIYFLQAAANILGEAIEREQVVQAEHRARLQAEAAAIRIARLQSLTVALSESLTVPEIAGVVIDQGMVTVGADYGAFLLLSNDRTGFEMLYGQLGDEAVSESWRRFEADPALPASQVAETGEPLWWASAAEVIDQFPVLGDISPAYRGATALLPLLVGGRGIGVIAFIYRNRRKFSATDREFMMTLAHQCAQAAERALLYQAEREARLAAETADQLKLKFLAMVSHELRTPLTSIKGFISSLVVDDVIWTDEQVREFLTIADAEADKLTALVEQLLDLSRLEAGTLAIELTEMSFTDILAIARPQLEMLTEQHVFRVDLEPDLPPVCADGQRIAQVLANLVSNSAKYGPPATAITISARQADNYLRIDVSDMGEGISPDQYDIVFEAFRQGDGRHGGAGLGLAICKGLIEAHGGAIWIEKTCGPGATMAFTLPFA